MNRRTMVSSLAAFSIAGRPAVAQTPQPFRVSLIGGAFDGQIWRAGVAVALDAGWKTYWRMPGEAGIPPQFDWSGSVGVTGVDTLYPVPGRLHDLSGETVGYENRVVFPIIAGQGAGDKGMLNLKLFFAVCKNVCIPAKAETSLLLPSVTFKEKDQREIIAWMSRVPVPGTPVKSAIATMDAGTVMLVLKLSQPADDIFVESASAAYFHKPVFSANSLEASLVADNVPDAAQLKGLALKLTIANGSSGIEQAVTVE